MSPEICQNYVMWVRPADAANIIVVAKEVLLWDTDLILTTTWMYDFDLYKMLYLLSI